MIGLMFVPVPYVVLGPGPTADTLGTDSENHEPLITVNGRETFPTEGALRLTTVAVHGAPGSLPPAYEAVLGWIGTSRAVVPVQAVFPPQQTAEQAEQENRADMLQSQHDATSAAMRALQVKPSSVVVEQVLQGAPAEGKLQVGDVVLSIDGAAVTSGQAVRDAVTRRRPGDVLAVKVRRTPEGGTPKTLTVKVTGGQSGEGAEARTVIGVAPGERFPFTVDIKLEDIGGPSAGLMFALGIYDKLTPGALNNGAIVAGTGTIDGEGQVGPIGGISQKLVGARNAGATVFLTPQLNCEDAADSIPDGLRLVKFTKLDDALTSLESLRTGQGEIPTC
jgi:PDZ domain-containing protein